MDDIDRALAEAQKRYEHLAAVVDRLEKTRLPTGRVLDAPSQARFDREVAAGQTAPPSVGDKLSTAIWGGGGRGEGGDVGHDLARTARDVGSGFTFGLTDRLNPELRAQETAEDPTSSRIGKASGTLLSAAVGPLAVASRGAQGLLGVAEGAVPALAKTAVGRIAGQTAANAAVGGGAGAAEAVGRGEQGADIRRGAVRGAGVGALLGGGLQSVAEGTRAAYPWLRETVGGKARELIEKYGGRVGPTTSGSGGAFDQELKGLPADETGVKQATEDAAPRVLSKADDIHERDVLEPYRQQRAPIDAGKGQLPVDVDALHQEMVKAYQSAKLTVPQRQALGSEIDHFEKTFVGPHQTRVMSERDLNDYKTMLQSLTRVGQAGQHTIPQGVLSNTSTLAKDMVDQGPYASLNKAFHEGAVERSALRSNLNLGPRESSNPVAEQHTVARAMREGGPEIDAVRKSYPELERDLDLPELLRAKEKLQFGIGNVSHGNLVNRLKHEGLAGGVGYAAGHAVGHGALGAGLGLGISMVNNNTAPLVGRYLLGPARAAANLPPVPLPQLPSWLPEIQQAYEEARARLKR